MQVYKREDLKAVYQFLLKRGLTVGQANAAMLLAIEYRKPSKGKWENNT